MSHVGDDDSESHDRESPESSGEYILKGLQEAQEQLQRQLQGVTEAAKATQEQQRELQRRLGVAIEQARQVQSLGGHLDMSQFRMGWNTPEFRRALAEATAKMQASARLGPEWERAGASLGKLQVSGTVRVQSGVFGEATVIPRVVGSGGVTVPGPTLSGRGTVTPPEETTAQKRAFLAGEAVILVCAMTGALGAGHLDDALDALEALATVLALLQLTAKLYGPKGKS